MSLIERLRASGVFAASDGHPAIRVASSKDAHAAADRIEALEAALRAMHFNHIADGTLCWCPDPKFKKNTEDGLVLRDGYVHAPDCEMARAALAISSPANDAKEESDDR